MRVFCRFAPPKSSQRDDEGDDVDVRRRRQCCWVHVEDDDTAPVLPSTSTFTSSSRSPSHSAHPVVVTIGDDTAGYRPTSCASLRCQGVFMPQHPASTSSSSSHHSYGGEAGFSTQRDVFENVAAPAVAAAIAGHHCAVLAYGQTSTGKTHTMFGPDGGNVKYFFSVDARGLVPRIAEALFSRGSTEGGSQSVHVEAVDVRYMELYNETATDLVAKLAAGSSDVDETHSVDGPSQTRTRELFTGASTAPSRSRSSSPSVSSRAAGDRHPPGKELQVVYRSTEKQRLLRSIQHVRCFTEDDMLQVIGELSALRQVGSTASNAKSTRSHVILRLDVHSVHRSVDIAGSSRRCGQLVLVDLAGSESMRAQSMPNYVNSAGGLDAPGHSGRCSAHPLRSSTFDMAHPSALLQTQLAATRQLEMRNINHSLFALKKVVHALTKRHEHVPYKDSILTVVLEQALQSPFTTLVVCCSLHRDDLPETIASLRLATEAAQIPALSPSEMQHRFNTERERQRHVEMSRSAVADSDLQRRAAHDKDRSYRYASLWRDGEVPRHVDVGACSGGGSDFEGEDSVSGSLDMDMMVDVPLPTLPKTSKEERSNITAPRSDDAEGGTIRSVSQLLQLQTAIPDHPDPSPALPTHAATTAAEAESCEAPHRLTVEVLQRQCTMLSDAYDAACHEIAVLKDKLRASTLTVGQLQLEVAILKNAAKLGSTTSITLDAEESLHGSSECAKHALQTPSSAGSLWSKGATEDGTEGKPVDRHNHHRAFGKDCTNTTSSVRHPTATQRSGRRSAPVVQVLSPESTNRSHRPSSGPTATTSTSMVRI